jgi:hypothetical protein
MIRVISGGTGVQISGGHASWPQFYNSASSTGNSLIGQVRYNGSSQNMEVYDGSSWLTMPSSYSTVELAPEVQSVLNWARMKMAEESRIQQLAAQHPTVADALLARDRAEDAVKIAVALCNTQDK